MRAVAIALACLVATPALAQRTAVAIELSPERAAEVFIATVKDVCLPAVSGNGVSALPAAGNGGLRPTQDGEARRQANAGPDETVWEVSQARGVVTVREKPGQCAVSVYGPPAGQLVKDLEAAVRPAFASSGGQETNALTRQLQGAVGGKALRLQIEGAEPGTAGNLSQFSVVTASVHAVQ